MKVNFVFSVSEMSSKFTILLLQIKWVEDAYFVLDLQSDSLMKEIFL